MSQVRTVQVPGQEDVYDESYYLASQWQLVWRKFRKHKLALLGMVVLAIFYLMAIFADFFATNPYQQRYPEFALSPPQKIHFFDEGGRFHFPPFVYVQKQTLDMKTLRREYTEDTQVRYPLRLLVHGYPYKLLGLFETDIHLVGVEAPGVYFPFGTDEFGRDIYARTIFASRISLSIGFVGVIVGFVIGSLVGGVSGYFGGTVDLLIQRLIEFIISIPTIPLWIALAAALPPYWTSVQVYFGITVVLATVGWTGLARTVRGKILETREADFIMAARISNVPDFHIIVKHLLPSFASYLIVSLTLGIPGMILGETALSFLGIGIRPPAVSWGVLLQDAQNIRSVAQSPWLFIPAVFVVVAVLCFNFVGDGLRDAADPYK
ncbi:MAG: ABC transporter permease [Chloroflexi bacterium]|nr:MAG: ABC transporter permease [Chloroflexota bacterium]